MDYRFKKEAKNDLDEIYKYYEEKSPGKSREFVRNVREKLKYIAEKPFAYSEDKDTGVRRAPIKKFKHY
ncbi:MAG: type II toxin-antitoxin system RelE/ParE family toxin, partial [Spirochaetota bacterium]